jgi:outer membrane protein assembly factor BamB
MVVQATGWSENWPQFRGPTGQGHSSASGLPIQWSATENVQWKIALPGQGWSSPVFQDGSLYLTTAVEKGSEISLRVLRVDAESGKILWETEIFSARPVNLHSKNSHASPTPVLEGERLYAHFGHYGTACLDRHGKVLWRNDSLGYSPVHGNGGSPIIVDDKLIFSADGASKPFLAALDKTTGKTRWKIFRRTDARRTFSFSTPLVIQVDGRKQVISPGSNMVGAYDPEDGREIWRVTYNGYSVIPRPVFGHGLIYIGTGFDRPTVMAIRTGGAGDVTETHVAWTIARSAPNTPSLLLAGDELYMVADSGVASCLDARTGEVHWQERVGGNYSASPVHAEGRIYLLNEQGLSVVLKAGNKFEELSRNPIEERTLASCAVGGNALFIRTEKHLFKIADGK